MRREGERERKRLTEFSFMFTNATNNPSAQPSLIASLATFWTQKKRKIYIM